MKTLKEIIAAIDALPVEAFKNTYGSDGEINKALKRGWDRWMNSQERVYAEHREEEKRDDRRARDTALRAERTRNVKKWLKDGTLVKVSGARDGKGIREVISWDSRQLHCRQWLPEHRADCKHPDDLRLAGCVKVADVWIGPMAQMTTHEFNKVVKILG